jgi:hypothetical protein
MKRQQASRQFWTWTLLLLHAVVTLLSSHSVCAAKQTASSVGTKYKTAVGIHPSHMQHGDAWPQQLATTNTSSALHNHLCLSQTDQMIINLLPWLLRQALYVVEYSISDGSC